MDIKIKGWHRKNYVKAKELKKGVLKMVLIQGIAATKYASVLLCNEGENARSMLTYVKPSHSRVKAFGETWLLDIPVGRVSNYVQNASFRSKYRVRRG